MYNMYVFIYGKPDRIYRKAVVAPSLFRAEHVMRDTYGFRDGEFELEHVEPAWNSDIIPWDNPDEFTNSTD